VIENKRELTLIAPTKSHATTGIAYFERHGLKDRMDHDRFTKTGIPRGSEALERSIRQAIILRMTNSGMSCREESPEIKFQ
jgi:hypothetical protein